MGDLWKPQERNTARKDVLITNGNRTVFVLRFAWDPEWLGWVDFAVYEALAWQDDGTTFFALPEWKQSGDDTSELDAAGPVCDGFVKWDGCTQFGLDQVHIDHGSSLDGLFSAIQRARHEAAAIMASGGYDLLNDEYGGRAPT